MSEKFIMGWHVMRDLSYDVFTGNVLFWLIFPFLEHYCSAIGRLLEAVAACGGWV